MDTETIDEQKVAETTTDDSSSSPEVSPAQEDAKSAETQPDKGKSNQETPQPDEVDDSKLPFHKHPRWVEVYGENKEMKSTLDELAGLGIRSKADADNLLKNAEEAELEAVERGKRELADFILSSPLKFNHDLWDKHPEYAEQYDGLVISSYLARQAETLRSSNPDVAAELSKMAQGLKGKDVSKQDKSPVNNELRVVQDEKQETFDYQASTEISTAFKGEVEKLTKGYVFEGGDKQRTRFIQNVFEAANKALENNRVFTQGKARLSDVRTLKGEQLRSRRQEVVNLYLHHTTDPKFLRSIVDEEKSLMGLKMGAAKTNGTARREVTDTGTPTSGVMTQAQEDKVYEDLSKRYSGRELSRQFTRALSRSKSPAS